MVRRSSRRIVGAASAAWAPSAELCARAKIGRAAKAAAPPARSARRDSMGNLIQLGLASNRARFDLSSLLGEWNS
jgi:hypothetical protein